jgi:hypothetical protein
VTLLYLNKLDYTKVATYAWFVAYFGSVLVLLYIDIKCRKQLVNTSGLAGTFWRGLLLAHGIGYLTPEEPFMLRPNAHIHHHRQAGFQRFPGGI